ncbi:hypothetical protein XI06_14455, partial [Bradyrhizobium sp. CCBAU 11434]|nr:hypothetical protein [Bradyrhizobium sp. CCBAU 11434]
MLPTRRDKNAATISPIALEAVKRIDALFDVERGLNGQGAEKRLLVRIPTKSAVDSERSRPPVPIEAGQGF